MKMINKVSLVVAIVLCLIVACGCSASDVGCDDKSGASDKELIEALLMDDDLEFWATASAPLPYTQERFEALCDRCPDLETLMERDTAKESLTQYGPDLIRQYHGSDQAQLRLNALILADVIGFVCPDTAEDMEALVTELSEG